MKIKTLTLTVLLILLGLLISLGYSQDASMILKDNRPSLVSIFSYEDVNLNFETGDYSVDTAVMRGSGFIISPEGLVATSLHVLKHIDSILVKTSDSVFYSASPVYADNNNDIAVIRLLCGGITFRNVRLGN